MKIALVLFDWFPHGGMQRDCTRIGLGLVALEVEVDIICMSWEGGVPEGLNPVIPTLTGKNKVARRKNFAAYLKQQRQRGLYAAIVGFNRLPGLDFYFAADTCFAFKAFHERSWLYRLTPRSRQYLSFERAVFDTQSDTKIFMLSPGQKKEYLGCYPGSASRIIDILPGIDRNRKAGDDAVELRQSLRSEFSIAEDEFLVLQVGSGFPIKGVDRSLAAIASLPGEIRQKTRLFIVGRDEPGRFEKQAAALGVAKQVSFFESRDDLPRFFQGADLLLHPSYKESAGMVILEAIVAGLPVLTTETCGYAFYVSDADAGKVINEPFNQQHLNGSLLEMLKNGDRKRWKENGIHFGKTSDLYDMPGKVASLVLEELNGKTSRITKEKHHGGE